MKIKIILYIIGILLLVHLVSAGVTNPLPTELDLLKGESGRFKFQIQTISSEQEVICTYHFSNEAPFSVEFDEEQVTVPAKSVKEVYGTVRVPRSLDLGTYQQEFCVSCDPTEDSAGASVQVETCNLPITVNVVQEREKDNMNIPSNPSFLGIILVAIIIISIAALAFYLFERKQYHKEK